MEVDIYHQDETPIAADDREYHRLFGYAARAYAAEEIEAWQMACANGVTVTTSIGNPSAR
jgi:hypothetical protein